MDVISVALLISLICNVVQTIFYVVKLIGDYKKLQTTIELKEQRKSYYDLKDEDGPIFF
jgi:hypothetical protein